MAATCGWCRHRLSPALTLQRWSSLTLSLSFSQFLMSQHQLHPDSLLSPMNSSGLLLLLPFGLFSSSISTSFFCYFWEHVFTVIGSSWTVSRKSTSAECINEWDHPGKLFGLHFLTGQCADTRVCHALKTMNGPWQEQCSPAATSVAG